jgi:hypothetical protein
MNIAYWLANPLDEEYLRTLRHIKTGTVDHERERFAVAYLIALKCVHFDGNNVTITEKGEEALKFYENENPILA